MSTADQPVTSIEWVDGTRLSANHWNPNKQAPPEHRLLVTSILENGWTQPIVVREQEDSDGLEIVDGYHRWTVSQNDEEVWALTDGQVPIVRLPACDETVARLATVRHNRARGTHHVRGMSSLVADLVEQGMSYADIGRRLEMDDEEVERLADNGGMIKVGAKDAFGTAWTAG